MVPPTYTHEKVDNDHLPTPEETKIALDQAIKAKKDFGYEPLVKFWEGLEKTVEWWGLRNG